jgi:hypothetical protein
MGQSTRGRVTIEFAGVSDLERIVALLGAHAGLGESGAGELPTIRSGAAREPS